jgi:hypothetical protein
MKRSLMARKLSNLIRFWLDELEGNDPNCHEIDAMSLRILNKVESEGMQPPFNEEYYMRHWRNDESGYVWESEDE